MEELKFMVGFGYPPPPPPGRTYQNPYYTGPQPRYIPGVSFMFFVLVQAPDSPLLGEGGREGVLHNIIPFKS